MLLCSLYCLCVLKYHTYVKCTVPTIIIGNVLVGAVMLFNMHFGTNYIMMNELPPQLYEVYPFLDIMPPLAWLEIVGILAVFASCVPMLIAKKLDSKKEELLENS